MITQELLKEFKSGEKTVIITDIKCEEESCNQEIFSMKTEEILKPYSEVKRGYDIIPRTLEVEGHLNLNDNKEYYTNLVGFASSEPPIQADGKSLINSDILNDTYRSPTSHYIEVIETALSKNIEIIFNQEYYQQPHIIITIDEEYEELYRSYSTTFIKNESLNKFSGVNITFNNLKTKNSYPNIGICIIGDPIESYYDGLVKTEESVIIHLFEKVGEEKKSKENIKIVINGEKTSLSAISDACGNIPIILQYGVYTVKSDDDNYILTPSSFTVNKNLSSPLEIQIEIPKDSE